MHNGAVSDFLTICRAVNVKLSDAVFANIFGSTDSEHIAGLYMTYLTNGGDKTSFEKEYPAHEMAAAMHKAIATIIDLQRQIIGDDKRLPNSLNLCATDGVKLVACRFRNHKTSQPPTLYYSSKAGTTLNRKFHDHPDGIKIPGVTDTGKEAAAHGKHVIVASEPSTYRVEDWELIPKNQFIVVEADGEFKLADLPYKTEWAAEDHDTGKKLD